MERREEVSLAHELVELRASGSTFTKAGVTTRPWAIYRDSERFRRELERLFRATPHAIAHASELGTTDSFLRTTYAGVPLLLTRDGNGEVHALMNACRHRGMRLVADDAGCGKRFTCPYHAWTYSPDGALLAAPHFEEGFGELDKRELGLRRFACSERFGFIWVTLAPARGSSVDGFLAPVAADLGGLGFPALGIARESRLGVKANWKLLIEGGQEAYHFKVAHRNTIGPYFENNLSTYQQFGDHLRSVLPRVSLAQTDTRSDDFRLRDHANMVYWLAPNTQFLVQQDHIVWIRSNPLSAEETELRLATLVPASTLETDGARWEKNHRITLETLGEDFDIAEGIQASLASGLDQPMLFGRFESALDAFNGIIEKHLGEP
jgi:phenylpropionate dioxygenase-like ring-hydroxylating dioxygenase large terminal subunit